MQFITYKTYLNELVRFIMTITDEYIQSKSRTKKLREEKEERVDIRR